MLGGNLAPLEFKATLLEQGWFLEEVPLIWRIRAPRLRCPVEPSLGFGSVPLPSPELFPV